MKNSKGVEIPEGMERFADYLTERDVERHKRSSAMLQNVKRCVDEEMRKIEEEADYVSEAYKELLYDLEHSDEICGRIVEMIRSGKVDIRFYPPIDVEAFCAQYEKRSNKM